MHRTQYCLIMMYQMLTFQKEKIQSVHHLCMCLTAVISTQHLHMMLRQVMITHSMMDDNYCWNLHTVGSGEGYYITNGYAVPIQWSKSDRYSKTVYTYADGTEINVSDGRTYIEVSDVTMTVEVE